ncbi:MAG: DUF2764 domain-containing protein [Candidatus Marinimicrobia bacterium]|nr:DUF2764 domain-containing protein [Candidatus Neomarinimicrobiota bacterium]
MREYFYFMASLPTLTPGEPPALDAAEFLRRATGVLAPDDLAGAADLLAGRWDSAPHPFARRWRPLETQLRNAIARTRTAQRPAETAFTPHPHEGFDAALEREAAEALQRKNPLEREQALDRLRWRLVDELVGVERPFSVEAVMAYALRLGWAARQAAWQPAAGREQFTAARDAALPPDFAAAVGAESPPPAEQDGTV